MFSVTFFYNFFFHLIKNPIINHISLFPHSFNLKVFFLKDFSLKLINEGLQNKLQIYSERLGRQDKLISRLEEEIVHADEQCQEFLLYWNPNGDLKFINRVEQLYEQFLIYVIM